MEQRRLAIGSDHAGYALKERLRKYLESKGYPVIDVGTFGPDSVDYPDQAHLVARSIEDGSSDLGLLICGSGNGVNIVANKHKGVRSALAWNSEVAALARSHNNANVLSLPARFMTEEEAVGSVEAFLDTSFEGGRHERRVNKIEPVSQ